MPSRQNAPTGVAAIRCPRCKAGPGRNCVSMYGGRTTTHIARQLAAQPSPDQRAATVQPVGGGR